MNKIVILLIALSAFMSINSVKAVSSHRIAGCRLDNYTIVYNPKAEAEEGKTLAENLQKKLKEITGKTLLVVGQTEKQGKSISFIHSAKIQVFDYSVKVQHGNLVIDGGGCWAMQKAADIVADKLAKADIPANYQLKGTVKGKFLFPRRDDVNLRILDDNVWNYKYDTVPPVWKKAGLDCTDDFRVPQYAQLVRAYMPDIVTLQEYNTHMHARLYPVLQKYGYTMAYESSLQPWVWTPILYNKENLELIASNNILYTPARWSDAGSKSYTVAIFKHKSTGKTFAVLNTHLWWQSEKNQPGSEEARASQVNLIMAEAQIVKEKYNCTIFVTGDMNCYEHSEAMQQFIKGSYVPCYKAATVYGNKDNGHHICAPREVGVRTSRRASPEREYGAIDHCLIYNAQPGTEVKIFDCIQTAFTVHLTDHYPNLVDAHL